MATTKIGVGVALTTAELRELAEEAGALPGGWTVEAASVGSAGGFSLSVDMSSPGLKVTQVFGFGCVADARAFLKQQGEKYPQR